jgi:polyisoprenyl-phosphate glycosyltransferase
MKLSIIIPCFNEEAVICETHSRLKEMLRAHKLSQHELIYVNDGSRDTTIDLLESIAKKDRSVKVLSFSRNFGHQAAVTAGIHHCTGDLAVLIDADLQDPPGLIPDMIALQKKERCNVVYGVRKVRKGESIFKRITALLFYRLLDKLSDVRIPLDAGDFRLIDRKVITAFTSLKEKNKYIRGLISWIGFKQVPIYYVRDERFAGVTKYPLIKMLKFARNGMLSFSKKPLKIATMFGFISVGLGLLLAVYAVLAHYNKHLGTVSGWTSIIIAVIFFGGVQLLTVGVLGEYVGAVFDEVKNRPEYIIERAVNISKR